MIDVTLLARGGRSILGGGGSPGEKKKGKSKVNQKVPCWTVPFD